MVPQVEPQSIAKQAKGAQNVHHGNVDKGLHSVGTDTEDTGDYAGTDQGVNLESMAGFVTPEILNMTGTISENSIFDDGDAAAFGRDMPGDRIEEKFRLHEARIKQNIKITLDEKGSWPHRFSQPRRAQVELPFLKCTSDQSKALSPLNTMLDPLEFDSISSEAAVPGLGAPISHVSPEGRNQTASCLLYDREHQDGIVRKECVRCSRSAAHGEARTLVPRAKDVSAVDDKATGRSRYDGRVGTTLRDEYENDAVPLGRYGSAQNVRGFAPIPENESPNLGSMAQTVHSQEEICVDIVVMVQPECDKGRSGGLEAHAHLLQESDHTERRCCPWATS
nr:hypothetical protein CFP56_12250 [Quercus suber]